MGGGGGGHVEVIVYERAHNDFQELDSFDANLNSQKRKLDSFDPNLNSTKRKLDFSESVRISKFCFSYLSYCLAFSFRNFSFEFWD